MMGHEQIIEIRKRGLLPILVFVDTNHTGIVDEEQRLAGDDSAMLWVEPGDNVARLDLRFMVGLQASVTGDNAERVAEVAAALVKHQARRVMAAVMRKVRGGEYLRYEVVSQTDTEGVFEWPN